MIIYGQLQNNGQFIVFHDSFHGICRLYKSYSFKQQEDYDKINVTWANLRSMYDLFIYDHLFNDSVSSSACIAPNDRTF